MTAPNQELKLNEEQIFIKVPSDNGKGLSAIITSPHALFHEDFNAKGYAPSTHKMVVIVHGSGGHKNYCYHSLLAEQLASELGIFSVRFDFRNCGDSQGSKNPEEGRTMEQDVEDIDAVVKYFTSGAYRDIEFSISSIVAHSRGTASMFLWALEQQRIFETSNDSTGILVPNLVNCAGRFDYRKHLTRVKDSFPTWEEDGFYQMNNIYRDGEYRTVRIPRNETLNLTAIDLSNIGSLNTSVLTIHGLSDTAVPVEDSAAIANLLGDKHHLKLIKYADHSFYGTEKAPETEVPLNSRGQYNYNYYVVDYICDYLSHANELSRFYSLNRIISTVPRWKAVEGIANFRDIGGWRISKDEYVRPNYGFRSALPSKVTEKGKQAIKDLNIKAVFDFRSVGECRKDGVLEVEGVERFHVPVVKEEGNGSPEALMLQYKNLITSWATYKDIYRDMLKQGADSYKTVLTFIRDHPNDGFLFHCSAGKDRTGVMGMLLYLICGLDNTTISKEYELTAIGLKPMHPKMKKDFARTLEKYGDQLASYEKSISLGRQNWSVEKDGFDNIVSSRAEAMLATIDMFKKEFGGINTYLKSLGLDDNDVDTIRANLTINRSFL